MSIYFFCDRRLPPFLNIVGREEIPKMFSAEVTVQAMFLGISLCGGIGKRREYSDVYRFQAAVSTEEIKKVSDYKKRVIMKNVSRCTQSTQFNILPVTGKF